jgi:uncharacterized membrane protein
VSTYQWLLALHITAAFLFFGGSVAAGVLYTLSVRAERPSETAYLLRLIRLTLPVIFAGVAGTLVLGIWLWHERHYSIGAFWIWASIVLWALSGFLGQRGGEHQEKARKMAESLAAAGDTASDELRAILRDPKGSALSWLAGVATLGILVLMIWKPGS